jgi:hypothetical protein
MDIRGPTAQELINKTTSYIENDQLDHAAAACMKGLSRYPNHQVIERLIESLQIIEASVIPLEK